MRRKSDSLGGLGPETTGGREATLPCKAPRIGGKNTKYSVSYKRRRIITDSQLPYSASESENEKLPYGEDTPWLAAGRLQ